MLPADVLHLVPSAVHVHSRADFTEHDCQGTQSVEEIALSAAECGFTEVFLTEHTSNPGVGKPHPIGLADPLAMDMATYINRVGTTDVSGTGVDVFAGFEANILDTGAVDAPLRNLPWEVLVIASLHGEVPTDPGEVLRRFTSVALNPDVHMIGHFGRYVQDVTVDWPAVFAVCADPEGPTIVGANFNAMFTYGSMKARRDGNRDEFHRLRAIEARQYRALGQSGAMVCVELDVHNAQMWPAETPAEPWQPSYADIAEFLDVVTACVSPNRIVNSLMVELLFLDKRNRDVLA